MAKPILLCDTKGMEEEEWLECRRHGPNGDIPFTIGGSEVGAVLGVSPWVTLLELWKDKIGLQPLSKPPNEKRLIMGHMMEPIIAHWFAESSGYKVIEDNGLYQHHKFQFALANTDYSFIKPDGTEGVLEIKTTSYRNSEIWKKGICPLNYEYQIRFYLAVKDLDFGCVCCMWGNDPDADMTIIPVYRDLAIERDMFNKLLDFIKCCEQKREPLLRGARYPERAMRIFAEHYHEYQMIQDAKIIDNSCETLLAEYLQLKEEKAYLNAELSANKENMSRVSLELAELMGCHEYGVLETPEGMYQVVWRPDNRNRRLTVKYREHALATA